MVNFYILRYKLNTTRGMVIFYKLIYNIHITQQSISKGTVSFESKNRGAMILESSCYHDSTQMCTQTKFKSDIQTTQRISYDYGRKAEIKLVI